MAPRREDSGLQPVSRILEGALRDSGLADRLGERSALLRWHEVAGEDIARNVRAVDLEDGVLVLESDHGAWRQEVTMLAPMIIEKFNEALGAGTVSEIQWRDRPRRGRNRPGRKP